MKRRTPPSSSTVVVKKLKSVRSRKTYFDLLPFEVLVRLLRVVPVQEMFGDHWPNDLLSLSKVSERNRAAVLEALRYKVDICHGHTGGGLIRGLFLTFVRLFGDDLREINLVYTHAVFHGYTPSFRLPKQRITSLRKACIAGKKKHLELIRDNKSLTHLELTWCYSFRMTWKFLIETLRTLSLKSLTINISCDFQAPSPRTLAALAHVCQEVTELTFADGHNADYTDYWGLIKGLPRLEKLAINGKVFHEMYMKKLGTIRELKITAWLPIDDNMLPYTDNVVHLRQVQQCSRKDISKLNAFKNLRSLQIEIEHGAERDIQTKVYNLESLHLEWVCNDSPPRHQVNVVEDFYYQANTQAVISTIRNATQLRDLSLLFVCLPARTVVEILKIMGKNLRSLKIHVDLQKDHPGRRLAIILCALAAYCPRIERLEFYGACHCIPASPTDKRRWLATARKARDNCPDLDLTTINFYLSSFFDRH